MTKILNKLKSFFGPSQEEIEHAKEQAKKIEILDQLYKDIKTQRAEGDYLGKYPDCRYSYDSFTGTWVNQGRDGVKGPDGVRSDKR
jgi:hypothetical protein